MLNLSQDESKSIENMSSHWRLSLTKHNIAFLGFLKINSKKLLNIKIILPIYWKKKKNPTKLDLYNNHKPGVVTVLPRTQQIS